MDLDSSPMVKPSLARIMSVATDEDEADGKACLRLLHMLAAFAVVGLNVASQWVGGDIYTRPVSAAMSAGGGVTFLIFCVMVGHTAHYLCLSRSLSHITLSSTDVVGLCVRCGCGCLSNG